MRAVIRDTYGSPDVLRVADVPVPVPSEGHLLVRVHASSINDYDYHLLTGQPFVNRMVAPVRPKHRILGCDISGVVESVGAGVAAFRRGDEVYGDLSASGLGAFAEYVSAPARAVAHKPRSLTFEEAAAVPQAGGLAAMGLLSHRPPRSGDDVLVNGGGGGVGTFAIQAAKSLGAHVTGVDANWKLGAMRAAGADRVVDYQVEDAMSGRDRYDLIVDIAAYRAISTYRRCLTPGGYAGLLGGSVPRVLLTMVGGPLTSVLSSRKVGVPFWRPNHPSDVEFLSGLLASGDMIPVIDSVVPLEGVADAFRRFGAQQHSGKIVITV
jgi:NADPH:quinone reductase-like Zn-dependent oxidoreductase